MATDIQQLLNNKLFLSAASAIGGALLGNFIAIYRNRIKLIEYTVTHDRVGLSADDAIFGSVRVTWQGQDVTNLYTSTVTIQNTTLNDYTDLKIKVYTGNTLLLTERAEIAGTTYIPRFTDEYLQAIHIPEGVSPTAEQIDLYRHQREYRIPVLNRGQRVIMHYLTSVPTSNEGPAVWVDMLHPNAQVAFRPIAQQIHGVPIKLALPLGLLACLLIFIFVSIFISETWVAAAITLVVGLIAQSIGAWLYRALRFMKRLILH